MAIMFKLNIEKVIRELARLEMSKTEFARRVGISKQLLNFTLKNRTVHHVFSMAQVFDMDPKDLIK